MLLTLFYRSGKEDSQSWCPSTPTQVPPSASKFLPYSARSLLNDPPTSSPAPRPSQSLSYLLLLSPQSLLWRDSRRHPRPSLLCSPPVCRARGARSRPSCRPAQCGRLAGVVGLVLPAQPPHDQPCVQQLLAKTGGLELQPARLGEAGALCGVEDGHAAGVSRRLCPRPGPLRPCTFHSVAVVCTAASRCCPGSRAPGRAPAHPPSRSLRGVGGGSDPGVPGLDVESAGEAAHPGLGTLGRACVRERAWTGPGRGRGGVG